MKICGIVSEYNPFHKGHAYQINSARELGADAIVCIMSPNFVQRGDFAILPKEVRAKMAVSCGADLVLELPTPYAVSSAECFSENALKILKSTNIVNAISFGVENLDLELKTKIANALLDEAVHGRINKYLNEGISYPAAREKALCEKLGQEISEIIKKPNNILAIEYMKANLKYKMGLEILPILRKGNEHNSLDAEGEFVSASAIRENFQQTRRFVPDEALGIADGFGDFASIENMERTILYKLRSMRLEEFELLPDVSEGLHHRIFSAVKGATTINQVLETVKTKRYTLSRLRRIMINAFLDITAEMQKEAPSYIRPLALNDVGRELLKQMKKKADLPIITKVANSKKNLQIVREAQFTAKYNLAFSKILPGDSEWKTSIKPI